MNCKSITRCLLLGLAILFVVATIPSTAHALFHGVALSKACDSPVRVCDTNADCNDGNPCTSDTCDTANPNLTSCQLRADYNDAAGDTIRIDRVQDVLSCSGSGCPITSCIGDAAKPCPVGSVPMTISSVSGNTTCTVNGSLPCNIGPAVGATPAGRVIFQAAHYNPVPADVSPIMNNSSIEVLDLCDSGIDTAACSAAPNRIAVNQLSTVLVNGCIHVPNNSNIACGLPDTPGDCIHPGCEAGVCVAHHSNDPVSTPCTDTGNPCANAGCETGGVCNQNHVPNDSNIACGLPDNPGDCIHPGCEAGVCVTNHSHDPDSTTCPDTDNNPCTAAGCEASVCVQDHVTVPCNPQAATFVVTDDRSCLTEALNQNPAPATQDFEGYSVGTNLDGIEFMKGVYVTSPFANLEVFSGTEIGKVLFGFDDTTRQNGNGYYDIHCNNDNYNAVGFNIAAWNPLAPGPANVEVYFSDGTSAQLQRYQTSGSENLPVFFGIIADRVITRIRWYETPEVGGTGNEEVALDDFVAGGAIQPASCGLQGGIAHLIVSPFPVIIWPLPWVTLTFPQVTEPDTITAVIVDPEKMQKIAIDPETGKGYKVNDNAYSIKKAKGQLDSPVKIELTYEASKVEGVEKNLKIAHFDDSVKILEILDSTVDVEKKAVTGVTNSLSIFAVVEPVDYVVVNSPNGGEVLPSGSTHTIQWSASESAVKFDLKYSINGTALTPTWKPIANKVTGTSYTWTVPTLADNKKQCLVKVIGYDADGVKVGEDISDGTFKIAVVDITSPDGGEVLGSGKTWTIKFQVNSTTSPPVKANLYYTDNGGTTWKLITSRPCGPGGCYPEYPWYVPYVGSDKTKCKVRVVLLDAGGKVVGKDTSDGFFTIKPYVPEPPVEP